MKKTFRGAKLVAGYPLGCFLEGNSMVFNTRKPGYARKGVYAVCKNPKLIKTTQKKKKYLVFADKNKANCAGKGTPVKDENGCKSAAKAKFKKFKSSGDYASQYPKGCFLYENQFYYNKGKTGKANKNAQPVCVTTKSPTGTKKKLGFAGSGKTNCAGKGTPVKSENACNAAAKAMKKSFYPKTYSRTDFPKGCIFYKNRFNYNTDPRGKGNKLIQPVCVQVTGGK